LMGSMFSDAEKQMELYFDQHTIGSMLKRIIDLECPQMHNELLS
jgi:hypothetical protein